MLVILKIFEFEFLIWFVTHEELFSFDGVLSCFECFSSYYSFNVWLLVYFSFDLMLIWLLVFVSFVVCFWIVWMICFCHFIWSGCVCFLSLFLLVFSSCFLFEFYCFCLFTCFHLNCKILFCCSLLKFLCKKKKVWGSLLFERIFLVFVFWFVLLFDDLFLFLLLIFLLSCAEKTKMVIEWKQKRDWQWLSAF